MPVFNKFASGNKIKMDSIKTHNDLINYLKQKQQTKITKKVPTTIASYQPRLPSAQRRRIAQKSPSPSPRPTADFDDDSRSIAQELDYTRADVAR
jgi:hypothetical protein